MPGNKRGCRKSRSIAIALGLKHYCTGIPCIKGHMSERNTNSSICMQCAREADARRRAESPHRRDEMKEYLAVYRVKNQAKIKLDRATRFVNNRQKNNSYFHARRVRLRGVFAGNYTAKDVDKILISQRRKCGYCRVKLIGRKFHVDHIVPVAKGGNNSSRNIQILCAPCNRTKHAKDPIVFAQSIGLLL